MTKIYSWLDTPDGGFVPPQALVGEPHNWKPMATPFRPSSRTPTSAPSTACTTASSPTDSSCPRQKKIVNLQVPLPFKKDAAIFKLLRKQAEPCREIDACLSRAIRERYKPDAQGRPGLQGLRQGAGGRGAG